MNTWDSSFELEPLNTDMIGAGNEEIQVLKEAVRERLAAEHEMNLSDAAPQPRHGFHKAGSASVFVAATAPTTTITGETLGSLDIGRVWLNSTTAAMYVWNGTVWVAIVPGMYAVTDADSATANGFYKLDSAYANSPEAGLGAIIVVVSETTTITQRATIRGTSRNYVRTYCAGAWTAWSKDWNASNDGAASGLDADLLDGLHAASASTVSTVAARDASGNVTAKQLVSDVASGTPPLVVTSPTMVANLKAALAGNADTVNAFGIGIAGAYLTTANIDNLVNNGLYAGVTSEATGTMPFAGSKIFTLLHMGSDTVSAGAMQIAARSSDGFPEEFVMRKRAGGSWSAWATIWTSANDGPGSGLDADTVSGYGIGALTPMVDSLDNYKDGGIFHDPSELTNSPWGATYRATIIVGSLVAGYCTQTAIALGGATTRVKVRSYNGTWSVWQEIYTSGADGSDGNGGQPPAAKDATTKSVIAAAASGTAPFTVTSATVSANLNADMVDGAHLDTDANLAANSDAKVASQKAVKAYADAIAAAGETAAGILAKLITVDGPGSQLDADTVSGYGIGVLVPPQVADCDSAIKSGFYYVADSGSNKPAAGYYVLEVISYSADWKVQIAHTINAVGEGCRSYRRNFTSGSTWGSWYQIWNSSSDGFGSGLDADTVSGYGIGVTSPTTGVTGTDIDALVKGGYYYVASPVGTVVGNHSLAAAPYILQVLPLQSNVCTQILYAYDTGYQYIRTVISGTPGSWYEVWTALSDGNGGQPPAAKYGIVTSNTLIGLDALAHNTTGADSVAAGAGALHANTTGYRNTALGSAALTSNTTGIGNIAVGFQSAYSLQTGSYNTVAGYLGMFSNTAGDNNIAIGEAALYNHTVSDTVAVGYEALKANTTGINNCAVGHQALNKNTIGIRNTAVGYAALFTGVSGDASTAVGFGALYYNLAGYAVGVGYEALKANTTGAGNTALGASALTANTIGTYNTAGGKSALAGNVSGTFNTAFGFEALLAGDGVSNAAFGTNTLRGCTAGVQNTGMGAASLYDLTTGSQNTALGYLAGTGVATYVNTTSLGASATVTGSNQVQLGDSATTTYVYGTVQNRSDLRDKADVRDTVLGLDFVRKLRPVDFRWDYREDYVERVVDAEGKPVAEVEHAKDGSRKRVRYHHGLIAQEVKGVMDAMGVDFGGYQDHSMKDGKDVLSIGYDELVAPLVKAMQEMAAYGETMQDQIRSMQAKIAELEAR